ncbi:calcium-binding protein [Campylobacter pinnipediorum]|uniref:calcium-binding protein n=1 Tax=Campylobacter pinnipediorum TaxID=1965231 RepID=UPI000995ADC3|nr:calcium-binding protein [Campylobacter pinnipediorum]
MFNRGDGVDTIIDGSGDSDTIKFGEGISRDDLIFIEKSQNSLIIKIKDTADSITIQEMFRYEDNRNRISKIELSDGGFISSTQINKVIEQLNSYTQDNGLTSITQNDIQNNQDMMQIVMNGWGN